MNYLLVGVGGFVGAVLRYFVVRLLTGHADSFPYATLTVNVMGSFMLGLFSTWILHKTQLEVELRLFIQIGLLGSFTTFSAFSIDTLNLALSGHWSRALVNVGLNVALCLSAVWLGVVAARQLS